MLKNISFYIKLLLLTLLFVDSSNAIELSIIPLKKPILDKITEQNKLAQGIIRPKSKPIKKIVKQKTSNEILSPKSKPSKKIKKTITKTVEKKITL
jgi:soluble lytic murein transglycosylase